MSTFCFPALHVDHLSLAVHSIAETLEHFRRHLPIRMHQEPAPGYDPQFTWADFFIGDWKLEVIESARSGSFVERFLARRGEGFHHLSIDVEEGALGGYLSYLERNGLRIVERTEYVPGVETAFISPRTAPGILIQFWQVPGFHGALPPDQPTDPVGEIDGLRYRVSHVALAVHSIDDTLAWFRRIFPVYVPAEQPRAGNGTGQAITFWLAGYKMALFEPATGVCSAERLITPRGEGVHHVAIDVDRLDLMVQRLEADGLRVVRATDIEPDHSAAFVDPRDTHGLLIEFRHQPDLGGPHRP